MLGSSFQQESQFVSCKHKGTPENGGEGKSGICSWKTLCCRLSWGMLVKALHDWLGISVSMWWAHGHLRNSFTVPRICTGTKCITGASKIFQPGWNSRCVRDQSLGRASHKLHSMLEPRIRMAIERIKANAKHRLGYCFSHFWTMSGPSIQFLWIGVAFFC